MAVKKDGPLWRGRRLAVRDLVLLPPTLRPTDAFDLIGVGHTSGYQLIRSGVLPHLRLGGKLLVPTAPLLRLVGVDESDLASLNPDHGGG